MKGTKKLVTMMLAMALALSLCGFVMAEGETDNASGTITQADATADSAAGTATQTDATADSAAADALKEAEEKSQALNDALTAYNNAKRESRKQARLASLKEELDGYVAAGSMTQEQADLLLSYYAEQLAQNANGMGKGRGGKGIRNGRQNGQSIQNGPQNGQSIPNGRNGQQNGKNNQNGQNMPQNGYGRGRKRGGMNQQTPAAPADGTTSATPQGTGV